jgi:hypothetical protein
MRARKWTGIGLGVLLGSAGMPAFAAESGATLKLRARPPIGKDIDAFPRVISGASPSVMTSINRVLARADAWARAEQVNCKRESQGNIERSVSTTLPGPRYASFVAADNYYCGGAINLRIAFVFDLKTGAAPNWPKLLPGLELKAEPKEPGEDDYHRRYSSNALSEIYLKAARLDMIGANPDAKAVEQYVDCDGKLNSNPLSFGFWIDPTEGGVVVEPFGVNHRDACVPEITIPLETIRALGASPDLLAAAKPGG